MQPIKIKILLVERIHAPTEGEAKMIHYKFAAQKSDELITSGYTHIPAIDVSMSSEMEEEFQILQQSFDGLMHDHGNRFRRYLRVALLPNSHDIDLSAGSAMVLGSDYVQSAELLPEVGGAVRLFGPLDPFSRNNRALRALIMADWRLCAMHKIWPNASMMPVQVGVHLIRLVARPGDPGIALPPRPHKDGEFYTIIHFVNRHGVTGGDTEFYANGENGPGALLFKAPLQSPLDTFGVFDPCGYHNVKPVEVLPGFSFGWRDVLITDFTPMMPVTVDTRGTPQVSLPKMRRPELAVPIVSGSLIEK